MERFVGQKGTDVLPHLLRWSFQTSHQTILDTKVKEDEVNKLIESWQSLLMVTMLNIALPFCRHTILSTILGFKRRKVGHLDRINAFMNDVLEQKLNSPNDPDSPIVINRLVDQFQSGQIGYNHIKGECNSMVIASLETTALLVTHTLILLAIFPEYQGIAFEELKSVFPTSGEFDVASEDLLKLVYMDRIVNETLRLIPPVPVVMREAKHDLRLSNGVIVPIGVATTIDIFNIHRNKDVWGPNADTFNPDHFLPEKVRDRHPYAFIPFSKGKRNCIGGRYALMSAKIALAKILRNYKLSTSFRYEDLVFIDNIGIKLGKLPQLDFHLRS
nr:probable cytochrome P450 313a3 [Drosophila bipectinata]